jgi:hypothetical protein
MRLFSLFAVKRVVVAAMCAAALVASACADGPGGLTGPSASATGNQISALTASAPRSGDLRVTKECSEYTGAPGSFCTIISSNVKAIEAGSRVIYAQTAGASSLDSDVVLDTPGPGNNRAFGHCALDFATLSGRCTFDGGTGKFIGFQASAAVSYLGGPDWAWDGTFSFKPQD